MHPQLAAVKEDLAIRSSELAHTAATLQDYKEGLAECKSQAAAAQQQHNTQLAAVQQMLRKAQEAAGQQVKQLQEVLGCQLQQQQQELTAVRSEQQQVRAENTRLQQEGTMGIHDSFHLSRQQLHWDMGTASNAYVEDSEGLAWS